MVCFTLSLAVIFSGSTAWPVVHTVIFLTNEIKDMSELNLIKGLVQHPIDALDLSGRKKGIKLAFDHYGMKR